MNSQFEPLIFSAPLKFCRDCKFLPNPLDPTNNYFRKCLQGHVSYSVHFAECPSCKIVRKREPNREVKP